MIGSLPRAASPAMGARQRVRLACARMIVCDGFGELWAGAVARHSGVEVAQVRRELCLLAQPGQMEMFLRGPDGSVSEDAARPAEGGPLQIVMPERMAGEDHDRIAVCFRPTGPFLSWCLRNRDRL